MVLRERDNDPRDLFGGWEGAVVWVGEDGRVVYPTPDELGAPQLLRDLLQQD